MAPETREFTGAAHLPGLGFLGFSPDVPVNLALPLALLCAFAVWLLVWRTPWGYGVRVSGVSPAVAAAMPARRAQRAVMVVFVMGWVPFKSATVVRQHWGKREDIRGRARRTNRDVTPGGRSAAP